MLPTFWSMAAAAAAAAQMVDGLNDALLRASAEGAAQAILLSPLATHEEETEDAKLAGKVMTGGRVDMKVSSSRITPNQSILVINKRYSFEVVLCCYDKTRWSLAADQCSSWNSFC
jgi:hypothetical protein